MPDFSRNGDALSEDVAVCSILFSVVLHCSGSVKDMSERGFSTAEVSQAHVGVRCGFCTDPGWLLSPVLGAAS